MKAEVGRWFSESDTSSVGSTGHRRKARGILWKPGVMSFPNEIMVRNKSEGQELLISSGQKKKKKRIRCLRGGMVYFKIRRPMTGKQEGGSE